MNKKAEEDRIVVRPDGWLEFGGLENDGPSKNGGWNLQDWKMTDEVAGVEFAGLGSVTTLSCDVKLSQEFWCQKLIIFQKLLKSDNYSSTYSQQYEWVFFSETRCTLYTCTKTNRGANSVVWESNRRSGGKWRQPTTGFMSKSQAGWLPRNRDQLCLQRLQSSMGLLYLLFTYDTIRWTRDLQRACVRHRKTS